MKGQIADLFGVFVRFDGQRYLMRPDGTFEELTDAFVGLPPSALADEEFAILLDELWPDVGRIDTGSAGPTDLHAEDV